MPSMSGSNRRRRSDVPERRFVPAKGGAKRLWWLRRRRDPQLEVARLVEGAFGGDEPREIAANVGWSSNEAGSETARRPT
jgi:hypothetical protein